MDPSPNIGKKLEIETSQGKWLRFPIKTHFVLPNENIDLIIEKYVVGNIKEGDIVSFSQKIISLIQNKVIYKKDLKVGFWAKFLSKFVKKTPYGFSVGNPLKMQVAINMAGLPRIFLAGFLSILGKMIGKRGVFYKVVGHQVNEIDGFYGEAFKEYLEMGILGPEKGDELCDRIKEKYGFDNIISDVNDLGGNILGRSKNLKEKDKLMLEILKDNPIGQGEQQTPIIILRKAND
jgi:hypothetical protein